MAHYVPIGLMSPSSAPLVCALGGCDQPIPHVPSPPPFSLLRAAGAAVNPTQRDVRIFFCSAEHRDQYWKSEQGWLDRRVAMPSERAMTGPAPFNRFPWGSGAFEQMMMARQGTMPWMSPLAGGAGHMPMTPAISQPATPVSTSVGVPWSPAFLPRPGW